jgi:hypothetical protein
MNIYIYLWLTFLALRALHIGYQKYQIQRKAGMLQVSLHDKATKNTTQSSVAVKHTLAAGLATFINPGFLLIESIKFLPVAAIYYLIS